MHLTAVIYSVFSVELKADHSLRTATLLDVQVAEESDVLASRIARMLASALSTMASRVLFVEAETVFKRQEAIARKSVDDFIFAYYMIVRKNEDQTIVAKRVNAGGPDEYLTGRAEDILI